MTTNDGDLVLLIRRTDIPGLVEAALYDKQGSLMERFPELTMGQVAYVANERGASVLRDDGNILFFGPASGSEIPLRMHTYNPFERNRPQ